MAGVSQVIVLFVLIVLGYYIKKKKMVSDEMTKDISSIVINFALPAFILNSMAFDFSKEVMMKSGILIVISFLVYGFAILTSKIFTKAVGAKGRTRDVYEYMCTFSNVGFMGYPVIYSVFGDIGVFYAAIYNLSFNLLTWSYGAYIICRNSDIKAVRPKGIIRKTLSFFNPALVAVTIGFILFVFSIKLPETVYSVLAMLGGTVTPLSMMSIGFILSEVDTSDILDLKVFLVSALRLIVLPVFVFGALKIAGFEGFLLSIPVILTGMPVAANTAIIAVRYDSDYHLASKGIFVTTLLSILTIPIIIKLVS